MRKEVVRRAVLSMVAGAMVVVACSGDGSSSEESIPASVASGDSVSTASEATTTSTSTTTTLPATTTTEALPVIETIPNDDGSAPETTEALEDPEIPLNTMYDPSTPEGEVEQVVLAENLAYARCLGELPECNVDAVTRFGALEFAEATRDFLERWNSEQLSAENVETLTARVEAVTFGEVRAEAEAIVCTTDAARVFQPATGLEAPDATGEFASVRKVLVLVFIDGGWKIIGSNPREQARGEGNNLCRL